MVNTVPIFLQDSETDCEEKVGHMAYKAHGHKFDDNILNADTVIVSCGLANFEESNFSIGESYAVQNYLSGNTGKSKPDKNSRARVRDGIWPGILDL